jgi:homogentisate 1,2-dioxygenase
MKRYFHFPKVEGQASRQAHADLPAGTFERESARKASSARPAHLSPYPPTGWVPSTDPCGPTRSIARTRAARLPLDAVELLHNAGATALLEPARSMSQLARNADGDELLFVHAGTGHLFCDYGHLSFEAGGLHPHSARHDVAHRVRATRACAAHRSD